MCRDEPHNSAETTSGILRPSVLAGSGQPQRYSCLTDFLFDTVAKSDEYDKKVEELR
jgi:hypothetical protein